MLPRSLLVSLLAPALALLGVPPGTASEAAPAAAAARAPRVLAISIDGLNTAALRRLGESGTPTFHRLLDEGAGTLNARTEVEQTVTLPNHTGMLTGRRVDAHLGGHGVTWDDDRPGTTVQRAAGHPVRSVFTVVHRHHGDTALFSTKTKFSLYQRSWPSAIDRFTVALKQSRLVRLAREDLTGTHRAFTFLHFSLPDRAGHESGGMSAPYLDAVRRTDRLLGTILDTVDHHPGLRSSLTVVLTADHGFAPGSTSHSDRTLAADYRVPFVAWGAGVTSGDLYDLNPDYRDPRSRQPGYGGTQPVRNGDLGNLSLDLLGLGRIPGSELDADQDLDVS